MIDISERKELLKYLVAQQIISYNEKVEIHYFSGGVSGTVAIVTTSEKEFIVKQALERLNVEAEWKCDQTRLKVEHNALKVYAEIVPDNVPKPFSFDESNYIMIREAAPFDAVMWKTDLLRGFFNDTVAKKAIDSLSMVHNRTAYATDIMEEFHDGHFFYDLRIDPYINYTVKKYPELQKKARNVIDYLTREHIALVHGDYSPKNIMVKEDKIFIVDFETSYFGHPAFDIAFFSNHFLLKTVKNKQWGASYLRMLDSMMRRYFSKVEFMDVKVLEDRTIEVLGFLFLARVDGKSPAEYIQDPKDKDLIRQIAKHILFEDMGSFKDVITYLKKKIPFSDVSIEV